MGTNKDAWIDPGSELVAPVSHCLPLVERFFFLACQQLEELQRLELSVDCCARLVQPPSHFVRVGPRMRGDVVKNEQAQRRNRVTRTADRQGQCIGPIHTDGYRTSDELRELFRERVGISGAWASTTSPR
jgi:hypothetical protein